MHPRQYRLRFLSDVFRVLVLPALFTEAVLRYGPYNPGLFKRIALCALSIPTGVVVRSWISSWSAKRNAARLGAVLPPAVRGRWPGNLDIAVGLVRSMNHDYLMQYMADLFDKYNTKTLNTRILWDDQIWTIDEGNVKFMLIGPGFEWFHKGYWWQERLESFLGNGIFNRDKEEWHAHRQIARPWFTRDRISDLSLFDRHTTDTIDIIIDHARDRRAFDAQDLLARFTLDSASEFLFGSCLHTLQGALPVAGKAKLGPKGSAIDDEFGTFAWAFENAQVQVAKRTRIGRMWPLFEMFGEASADSNAIIQGWLQPVVKRALRDKGEASRDGRKDEDGTFLSHLCDNVDDPKSMGFQVLNMLLAGRDTTASTMTFAIYFICMHPEIGAKLREEILNEYGETGMPTLESMRNLKYLRAVINETLRLFPPVPMNLRLSDDTPHAFPVGAEGVKYYIAPGTQIMYNSLLIQRRPDLWGPAADEFRPERWLDAESVKAVSNNPFMFIPFHAGPRICLGQNFAYNEMSFFLVRIMQRFEKFELAPDAQLPESIPPDRWKAGSGRQAYEKIWPASSVTTYIKGGLWVRATPASG